MGVHRKLGFKYVRIRLNNAFKVLNTVPGT